MNWAGLLLASPAALNAAPVTFNRDVAPLVYTHCAPCHHQNGPGPFPLLTYADVSKHATQIVNVTRRRYMPPWPPERGYGVFAGDRSLTASQIQVFADWLAAGKPEGNAKNRPPPPHFSSQWPMGKPDLVVRMPEPYRMVASGDDIFRNFIVPTGLKQTRYVRGLDLRLTNPRVIHHANVVLDRTRSLRGRDREDGQPGFSGMDVITEAAPDSFDPDSHFLFWKPATISRLEPEEMSWRLDPDTDLVVNLHLQPTGKEEQVQAEIGLYFSNQPPSKFPMLVQLEHDGALRIPPGARNFIVTDHVVLPVAVDALAIYPHAHYLGKTIEAWAVLPGGEKRWLIRIPDWDINWQAEYEYKNPVHLPKGTRLEMKISYDNSTSNPRNPNLPPRLVLAGNRSHDEMGHVWLQLLPARKEDRLELQDAVMRRRLEKYPADFLAHYNLGALDEVRGNLDDALAMYQAALRIDPRSATARNSLAGVFFLKDNAPAAIAEWRDVLAIHPEYLNARYNVARALAAAGDLDEAAVQYRIFLQTRPDDAQAQAGLGAVLYKQRDFPSALACFRKAAEHAPDDADIETNFGTLLAMSGDLQSAKAAFERALAADPAHAAAKANLARVKAQLASASPR
ncbi:MAG TPA: tetratricopeptide repeat protein [Bryobacteraceae bacterium]